MFGSDWVLPEFQNHDDDDDPQNDPFLNQNLRNDNHEDKKSVDDEDESDENRDTRENNRNQNAGGAFQSHGSRSA